MSSKEKYNRERKINMVKRLLSKIENMTFDEQMSILKNVAGVQVETVERLDTMEYSNILGTQNMHGATNHHSVRVEIKIHDE